MMISTSTNMARPLDPKAYAFPQKEKGCKNVIWAILFFIFFTIIVALGIYGYLGVKNLNQEEYRKKFGDGNFLKHLQLSALFTGVGVAAVSTVLFTVVTLFMLKSAAGGIIKCCVITYGIFSIASGIYIAFTTTSPVYMIFMGILTVVTLLYIYFGWSHIKFAEACLEIAITVFQKNPSIVIVPIILSALQIVYAIIWGYSQFGLYLFLVNSNGENPEGAAQIVQFLRYPFLFIYFWVSLVFSGIVKVTCCAYICDMLLGKEASVSASFALALRNIGPISFGSAILAFIKTLRMMAGDPDDDGEKSITRVIAMVILQCIEDIVEYITDYAFVFVALYEKDFWSAAKDSWNLFKYRGFDMIVNDDFTGLPGLLFSVCGGIGGAIISHNVTKMSLSSDITEDEYFFTLGTASLISFMVGFLVVLTVYEIIGSYVKSIFVIFAQHPAILAARHPLAYVALAEGFNAMIDKNPLRYSREMF